MGIQTEYMSFKNRWTISSSYDFQAHLQRFQRRCCFSQTALLWFEVFPDLSPALPGLSPALPGARRHVVGAPRLVAGAPSDSEGRQECPPKFWYSPEIDASKFTLHILSDTPGGFQCLKYILLMSFQSIWNNLDIKYDLTLLTYYCDSSTSLPLQDGQSWFIECRTSQFSNLSLC